MKHGVRPELLSTAELCPIEALTPFPGNARLHDDDELQTSLREHGQYRAVVVRQPRADSELGPGAIILAGNGTTYNAELLGWDHVAVSWVDCDDRTARKINLMDNRASDLAKDDPGDLMKLLLALDGDYTATGWNDDDVRRMYDELHEPLSFEPDDSGGEARLDRRSVTDCPACGHTFTPKTRSIIGDDDDEDEDDE